MKNAVGNKVRQPTKDGCSNSENWGRCNCLR